ncbi:hypothetical protein MOSE0_D03796 [Monosporozyma servazzii]
MDNSNNSIFGKFSRLRKKPQQPLTDLTELYSKVANESIYYKKLEETRNYKHALQGWKALTTDVMFQLTTVNHHYPNTEHYTIDELSLLSGVRELYHRATTHMEELQILLRENPELSTQNYNVGSGTNRYHTRDHKASLTRMQPMTSLTSSSSSTHGFSNMTLRGGSSSTNEQHSYSFNDYSNSQPRINHEAKVNFSNSKPLTGNYKNRPNRNSLSSHSKGYESSIMSENISEYSTPNNNSLYSTPSNGSDPFENFNEINSQEHEEDNIPNNIIVIDSAESANNTFVTESDGNEISPEQNYSDNSNEDGNKNNVFLQSDSGSDSDAFEFDVSEYYEDDDVDINNDEPENEDEDGYLHLDDEDMARLQAFDKLNGSPNRLNDQVKGGMLQDLANMRVSPSKSSTAQEVFIPSIPENIPPPLPKLPRVPVVIQPILPEMRPKRHNLLNKNMGKTTTSSNNSPVPHTKRPIVKVNKSTPAISTSTQQPPSTSTVTKTRTHNLIRQNKLSSSTSSLTSQHRPRKKLSTTPSVPAEKLGSKNDVSAAQVAKLVYKSSNSSDRVANTTKPAHKVRNNITNKPNINKKAVVDSGTKQIKKITVTKGKSTTTVSKSKKDVPTKSNRTTNNASSRKTGLSNGNKNKSTSSLPSKANTASPSVNRMRDTSTKKKVSPSPNSRSKEDLHYVDSPKEPNEKDTDEKDDEKEDEYDKILKDIPSIDKALGKQILQDIVVHGDEVHWNDIAGLNGAKNSLKEAVVYPFLRPDLFMGLRQPVTGMLLFGPPGTGKTMLARAVACESKSTFFSISASSLTSKYLGESEKLVRALFTIARKLSPSIVFVDEIDSLLGSRNQEGENESSRRIKNEFLVQWSSLSSAAAGKNDKRGSRFVDDKRVLVLAATNLPWSIDEAARRRFVRRQYIPLPEDETRLVHIKKLLAHQNHTLTNEDFDALLELTQGYSGSDITSLAKDAAMGPLRELGDQLLHTDRDHIRPIELKDFKNSLEYIKPSVSKEGLEKYEEWALQFGSSGT